MPPCLAFLLPIAYNHQGVPRLQTSEIKIERKERKGNVSNTREQELKNAVLQVSGGVMLLVIDADPDPHLLSPRVAHGAAEPRQPACTRPAEQVRDGYGAPFKCQMAGRVAKFPAGFLQPAQEFSPCAGYNTRG